MPKSLTEQIYPPEGRIVKFDETMRVYNLGCGKQNFSGTIGVDKLNSPHIAISHDLDKYPWPIEDSSADAVLAFHFMEHVGDLFKAFNEIYRISKNGARVLIEVPHFRYSSAFKDPTHVHFFTAKTIYYFLKPNHTYTELPFRFKLVNLSIGYPANNPWTLKYWIKKWLTSKPKHIEMYDNLYYIFFRAKFLVFELEVEK
jgi:SAM-dependent methyltransferase